MTPVVVDQSEQDQATLRYIAAHITNHGYPPSVRDLANHLGVRSSSTAHKILARLIQRGWIDVSTRTARALRITDIGAAEL